MQDEKGKPVVKCIIWTSKRHYYRMPVAQRVGSQHARKVAGKEEGSNHRSYCHSEEETLRTKKAGEESDTVPVTVAPADELLQYNNVGSVK